MANEDIYAQILAAAQGRRPASEEEMILAAAGQPRALWQGYIPPGQGTVIEVPREPRTTKRAQSIGIVDEASILEEGGAADAFNAALAATGIGGGVGSDQYRQIINDYIEEQRERMAGQTDETATFEIIDFLTGGKTNYAKSYQRPRGAQDLEDLKMKLTQDLLERQAAQDRVKASIWNSLIVPSAGVQVTETQPDSQIITIPPRPLPSEKSSGGPKLSPRDEALQKQGVKDLENARKERDSIRAKFNLYQNAFRKFKNAFNKGYGTGFWSSLGGAAAFLPETTEMGRTFKDLDTTFKKLNVTELAALFQGMSRAIDSNAERRAFEGAQPSITNPDETNAELLLGGMAISLLADEEQKAKIEHLRNNDSLLNYVSPVFGDEAGQTSPKIVMVTPNQQLRVVNRRDKEKLKKQGYMSIDEAAEKFFGEKARTSRRAKERSSMREKQPEKILSDEEFMKLSPKKQDEYLKKLEEGI